MSLHEAFSQLKFDKRMTNWNLNQEIVTEDEIKQNIGQLEDVSDNAESMVLFPDPSLPESVEQDLQESSAQQEFKSSREGHLQNRDSDNMQAIDEVSQKLASDNNIMEKTTTDTNNNTPTATMDKEVGTREARHTDEDSSDPWW